ncbi:MAG: sigma-70 family RNA polymerase sigma factor [Planctomycetota bacterium]
MRAPGFDDPTPPSLADQAQALRRFAQALCLGDAEADDVSQEALVAALETPAPARGRWPHWHRGVLRNLARAQRRRDGRRRLREHRSSAREAVPSAAERAARLELEARLLDYVRSLPERQSEAVFLRYWEGLPPRAIAARLGIGLDAVKARLKRALAALRERLSEETPGGRAEWMAALGFGLPLGAGLKSPVVALSVGAVLTLAGVLGVWLRAPAPSAPLTSAVVAATGTVPPPEPATAVAPRTRVDGRAVGTGPLTVGAITLVRGRVLNRPTGSPSSVEAPASGIEVVVHGFLGFGPRSSSGPSVSATTDASGAFRIAVPGGNQRRQITIIAEGDADYREGVRKLLVGGGAPPATQVELVRYGHGDLEGVTLDVEGRPLAGVTVRIGRGAPRRATVSDRDGAFRFSRLRSGGALEAERDGWMVVRPANARQSDAGAWSPVRLVLVRSASLRLQFRDPAGGLRADVGSVAVVPSPAERYGHARSTRLVGPSEQLSQRVPVVAGEAVFDRVWSGIKLRIDVATEASLVRLERQENAIAVPLPGTRGQPIVAPPGQELSLRVELPWPRRVSGRVVTAAGAPAAGAHLYLRSSAHADPIVVRRIQADVEGRFALEVLTARPPGPAMLSATDVSVSGMPGSERVTQSAAVGLDLSRDHRDLLLVLQPTHVIGGRVVGPDGHGVRASLFLDDRARRDCSSRLSSGVTASVRTGADGTFAIHGVPAGTYDVRAEATDFDDVVVPAVRAGRQDLRIEVGAQPPALVQVEVAAPDDVEAVVLLRGRMQPCGVVDAPPLAVDASYADPAGWPDAVQDLWSGGSGSTGAAGVLSCNLRQIDGTAATLRVQEGLWWFGAKGRLANGGHLFPIGTGLVRVTAGTYRIRFELRPVGRLEGRVMGGATGLHLALALLDGRLVSIDARQRQMAKTFEPGAAGDFLVERAPSGAFELRCGTREELVTGQFRSAQQVTIRAGETTAVRVQP